MRGAAVFLCLAVVLLGGLALWNHGSSPERRADAAAVTPAVHPARTIIRRHLAFRSARVDLYSHDHPGMMSAAVRGDLPRVYVPNSASDSVDVIDPSTYRVVEHFAVGALPQHVTPGYDLKTLYVNDDVGNTLTPIDPRTAPPAARFRSTIPRTSTSRRAGATRSWSRNGCIGSTFAMRIRCA